MSGKSGDQGERQWLIQTALDLVREEGRSISRDDLARVAGLSRNKIERFFVSEDELFDAVAEEFYSPLVAIIEEVLASHFNPPRKMYEFYARRFVYLRDMYHADPAGYRTLCDIGSQEFERVRGYVDLGDHYLATLVAEAQADGAMPGLKIDEALTLINQMTICYSMPDMIALLDGKLTEAKLARIVDTMFAGMSGQDRGAAPVSGMRIAG